LLRRSDVQCARKRGPRLTALPRAEARKRPDVDGFLRRLGIIWGVSAVKQQVACTTTDCLQGKTRGDDRNRTGVDGFAGRCVTTPPRRRDRKGSDGVRAGRPPMGRAGGGRCMCSGALGRDDPVDRAGLVVAHVERSVGAGQRVDGTSAARAVRCLEAADEGRRGSERAGSRVPGQPEHGGGAGWLTVPRSMHARRPRLSSAAPAGCCRSRNADRGPRCAPAVRGRCGGAWRRDRRAVAVADPGSEHPGASRARAVGDYRRAGSGRSVSGGLRWSRCRCRIRRCGRGRRPRS
jgi:hypothetical protein